MERIKQLLTSDVVERAVKTFVQAFVAFWLLADEPFSREVLVAAAAAGVSAVWNSVKAHLASR